MSIAKKIVSFPFLILVYVLERITRPMWDFLGGCFVFWVAFTVANSGVEPGNISNALRVVFWDGVLLLVAIQTLPELFFKIFDSNE